MYIKYIQKNYGIIIFLISFFSLLVGFFFNEDGTGTPLAGDFRDTLPYINELKKNLFIDPSPWTVHFPLHYILISWIDILFLNNIYITRLIFCLLSASVPLVFYFCLKEKFNNNNNNNLLILSSIVFLTPSFRYSAIWANDHIFASFFFLLSLYFFIKWLRLVKARKKNLIKPFFSIIFLTIACYSRQYYVVFFSVYLYYYFLHIDLKRFIIIFFFCFLLSLPGFLFLLKFPNLIGNLKFSTSIFNTVFGNFSSLLVYSFPIFFCNLIAKNNQIINIKKILLTTLLFVIFFFIFENKIDYIENLNLGAFFTLSNIFFNNYYFFYVTIVLGFVFTTNLIQSKLDLFIILLIIFTISGYVVLQKYFEPLFYFLFFLLMDSKFKYIILKNKKICMVYFLFAVAYYIITISDIIYKIKI